MLTIPRRSLTVFIALAVAVLAVKPVFAPLWWENHDMVAYPIRLIEYVQSVRLGNLFPRWSPDLYGGYGAPLFNFYAPLLFAVATPFSLLGLSATWALKLALIVYTATGLWAVARLTEELTGRFDAGLFALGLFAIAPYRYTQLIVRGDLAEYCAIALVPLAVLGYVRLHRAGPSLGRGIFAAVAHAAVLLTHTLTGQWCTEFLAIACLVWVIRDLRARRFFDAAGLVVTLGGALGLMSIYALPALMERDLVNIQRMTEGGFMIEKNFLGELKWALAPGFFFAGYALIVLLPCALVALVAAARPARRQILLWGGICAALLILMCSVSAPLWAVLPLAKFTQFPWRLLGFLAVSTAVLGGVLWPLGVPSASRAGYAALVAVLALGAARTYYELPPVSPLRPIDVPNTTEWIAKRMESTVVSDEYLPRSAARKPPRAREHVVNTQSPNIVILSANQSGIGTHLVLDATDAGDIELAHHWFPRWTVHMISGPEPATAMPSRAGLIRVMVPQAGHYDLILRFSMTPVRWIGLAMTVIAAILLPLLLYVIGRQRARSEARPA